jgi:hypothetical protein
MDFNIETLLPDTDTSAYGWQLHIAPNNALGARE